MDGTVTVRLFASRVSRAGWVLLMVFTVAVGIGAAIDLGGAAIIWMPVLSCLGVAYELRAMRMGVDATPSGLVIRSEFKTRTIAWTEIESFRIGEKGGPWILGGGADRGVWAVLRGGGVLKLPLGALREADQRARARLEEYRTHAA